MKKCRFRLTFIVVMVFALQFGYAASDAGAANTYVSDLPFVGTPVNGWGPVEKDMSNGEQYAGDGQTISLHGVTYAKGLGTHAHSVVTYNLAGQYTSFVSDIGIDDEVGSGGSVIFQVWVDGAIIYDSGIMTHESPTQHLNLDVTNKDQLQLVVNAGTTINNGHADWAGAYLVPVSPPRPLAGASGYVAGDGTGKVTNKTGYFHVDVGLFKGTYEIIPECPDGTQNCFVAGQLPANCTCSMVYYSDVTLARTCIISPVFSNSGSGPGFQLVQVYSMSWGPASTSGTVVQGLNTLQPLDAPFQFTCGQ